MKRIILMLLCIAAVFQMNAQTSFTILKLDPVYPKQNTDLSFAYSKSQSSLVSASGIDIAVYLFNNEGYKIEEPVITEKNGVYSGTVKLNNKTSCIAFVFSSGENKDLNNGKGYIVPVYNEKNTPVKDYFKVAANLEAGTGLRLFGLPKNNEQAIQYFEDGLRLYPELKRNPDFFNSYIQSLSQSNKPGVEARVKNEVEAFSKNENLTEKDYSVLTQLYILQKDPEKVEKLMATMKTAFPKGEWAKNLAVQAVRSTAGADKQAAAYEDFIKKFPATEKDKEVNERLIERIANAYSQEKNYKAYIEWNEKLGKAARASNNNNFAWALAESGENLKEAKTMSSDATMYAKTEMLTPSGSKPETITNKEWKEQREGTYAMYGDTYAYVLYKLGDYATAYPISKEVATINKLKDADLNERYALLTDKVLSPQETMKLIEGFVENGAASAKTKELLKEVYVKVNKDEKGFDEYMSKLETTAKTNKTQEIANSILNQSSPSFNLKDFEGKSVSLDDLKGKVVVVDFWATWCGPCIASMPGMNKTLNKYKDNPEVKFLFIDTWERVDDKLKNAKAFMANKQYPFYVLMDNDNKMVDDFAVTGIPTKFIIDKQGKVRFKTIGYGGSEDDLVDELSTMIELASK